VRIFKNTWFTRFADREDIKDSELKKMVTGLKRGRLANKLAMPIWAAVYTSYELPGPVKENRELTG
jgi:hypothetical protein